MGDSLAQRSPSQDRRNHVNTLIGLQTTQACVSWDAVFFFPWAKSVSDFSVLLARCVSVQWASSLARWFLVQSKKTHSSSQYSILTILAPYQPAAQQPRVFARHVKRTALKRSKK